MIYIINIIFSMFLVSIKKNRGVILLIVLWTLLLGLQDGVGTDYQSYLDIFSDKDGILHLYYRKQEYIFYYIILWLRALSTPPQGILVFFSAIQAYLWIKILKKQSNKKVFLFFALTYINLFYYQMNALRNSIAVLFFTWGMLEDKKSKRLILILLGAGFHSSALLLLPFVFVSGEKFTRWLYLIIIMSIILSLGLNKDILAKAISLVPSYSHYLSSDHFQITSLSSRLNRLIYTPFYFYSIYIYRKENDRIFNLGIIAYSLTIILGISSLTHRMGSYFTVLSLFPLYFLFIRKSNIFIRIILIAMIILTFILKVVLLQGTIYDYNSILF